MVSFSGLSVVIPTVDEEDTIQKVIGGIIECCETSDITEFIIVYSKNSPTEYVSRLHALPELFPHVSFTVFCQQGHGPNAAIYEAFMRARGSHVINVVADMENDPSDTAEMLRIIKEFPDTTVTASRYICAHGYDNYSKLKKILNILFNKAVRLLFRSKQTDITYLFQCTPAYILENYDFSLYKDNFILSLALTPDIYSLPIVEIPSKVGKRSSGESHLKLDYYFNFIKGILFLLLKKPKRMSK